ncbi:short-chain dehydrogenase/reductase [Streptomyces sp. NPDC058661]|uniref:short-chain dehydrogenase/reductase n=1 Tax=Streptomyces sp. NPDC058661 TaxID=3346582 RepID=UPI0036492DAB
MREHVLEGRAAVVTGAARGVGAALARELSAHGMGVALLGREYATLRSVARTLPGDARCYEVDVTDREGMTRTAAEVTDEMGPASVVVANAGIAATGPFESADPELWERVVNVNLLGSATTARVFLPQLVRTRGYFLQIASTAAFGAAPMMSAYCASKAGVESFALSLRAEIAPKRVGVGIAYLHWTGTAMTQDIDEHPVLRALRSSQPRFAGRVHEAEAECCCRAGGTPFNRWCGAAHGAMVLLIRSKRAVSVRREEAGGEDIDDCHGDGLCPHSGVHRSHLCGLRLTPTRSARSERAAGATLRRVPLVQRFVRHVLLRHVVPF